MFTVIHGPFDCVEASRFWVVPMWTTQKGNMPERSEARPFAGGDPPRAQRRDRWR